MFLSSQTCPIADISTLKHWFLHVFLFKSCPVTDEYKLCQYGFSWYELFTGWPEGLQGFTMLITWLSFIAHDCSLSLLRSVLLFSACSYVPLAKLAWFDGLMQRRRNSSANAMGLRTFALSHRIVCSMSSTELLIELDTFSFIRRRP